MTLVERFIEFNGWPASRKTFLLAAIGLPAHVTTVIAAHAVFQQAGVLDLHKFDQVIIFGAAVFFFCLLAGLIGWRAQREWRWTAYAAVVGYGGFVTALLHIFGTWSTPQVAMWPLTVAFYTIWYDIRVGWVAVIYGLFLAVSLRILEGAGILPYAPALIMRSVDAQQSIWWIAGNIIWFSSFFASCIGLTMLVLAARHLQDQRLREAHQQLDRSARLIRRYVPSQLAEKIIHGEHTEGSKPERAKLTIFFSDLVGFTDIAEELEPEDLERLLNEYFSAMTEIAQKHGGTVDELSGDAILIFFGAPNATNDKDHAVRAARMALEMQAATALLNKKLSADGITENLQVRMAINTGLVTIGNFGSPDRMKYAALGRHVNLAARLQAHCEPGRILLSHATWLLVNDQMPCVEKGELQLKGIHKPVKTYELTPV